MHVRGPRHLHDDSVFAANQIERLRHGVARHVELRVDVGRKHRYVLIVSDFLCRFERVQHPASVHVHTAVDSVADCAAERNARFADSAARTWLR